MGSKGVERNTITYSVAISACEKDGQLNRCLTLYGDACSQGLFDHSLPPKGLDLRGMRTSVAKAAILFRLSKTGSGSARLQDDLAIDAGRGNHVLADGRRGGLRAEMEQFLLEHLGLPVQTVEGHDGRLIVRAADVTRFLQDRAAAR